MNIYVASPFAARTLGLEVSRALEAAGHVVTAGWLASQRDATDEWVGISPASTDEEVLAHAQGDLDDIDRADAYLGLTSAYVLAREPGIPEPWLHTGGRHVEMGYALAQGKKVALLGVPENVFARSMAYHFDDVDGFLTFEREYGL